MLSRFFVFLFLIFSFVTLVSAQSGRRVSSPAPSPASTPSVLVTQQVDATQETVGYSESSPSAARSISPRVQKNKDSKKDSKKENKKDAKSQLPTAATDAPKPADAAAADEDVLKINSTLVTIPVSVFDRNGLYIPNLHQADFKIFENGVEQEIAYFGTSEKPFTVVLLIDVSPSTSYKIEEIQNAANAFVEQLKPQDSVMVIEFDSGVHVLSEVTNDRRKIFKAIRNTGFGSGTSLYDAVDFTLGKRLDKIEGRKAIVLFTDGVDTQSSRASYESTLQDAEESEAMIFPIYYNTFLDNRGIGRGGAMSTPPLIGSPFPTGGGGGSGSARGTSSEEYTRGRVYLTELAAATAGKVFRPESTPGGLTAAFEGIAEELRRQYSIGYYPQSEGAIGERKQIKVRVNRSKLVIRSRDSYIVGGNNKTSD